MPGFVVALLVAAAALALLCLAAGYGFYRFTVVRPRRPAAAPNPALAGNAQLRARALCNVQGRQFAGRWGWQEVHITNRTGLRLAGKLFCARQPTTRTVVAVHGYHSTGLYEYAGYAPMYLETLGMNLLLVDNRAHGASEGKHIGFGYLDKTDVLDWLVWATETLGANSEIMLQGVSMGGAAVLMAAAETSLPPQVRWVLADCSFTSMSHQIRHLVRSRYHMPLFPLYNLANLFCRAAAGYSFSQPDALAAAAKIHLPILFVHGAADHYVPAGMVHSLYAACPSRQKQLYLAPGAVHAQSYSSNPARYLQAVQALLGTTETPPRGQ